MLSRDETEEEGPCAGLGVAKAMLTRHCIMLC